MNIRKIRFRISGGIAGLLRGAEVEGHELSSAERTALERLLAGKPVERTAGARDLIVYELEVETDAGQRRVELDEMNIPARLADLVKRLTKRAGPVAP